MSANFLLTFDFWDNIIINVRWKYAPKSELYNTKINQKR